MCNQKPEKKSSILIKNLNHNYFLNRQRRENCNQSLSFSLPLSLWEAEEEAAAAKQTPHTNTNAFSLWKRNQPKCCGKFLLLFCKNLFLIQEMHLIFFRPYMLSIIMICAMCCCFIFKSPLSVCQFPPAAFFFNCCFFFLYKHALFCAPLPFPSACVRVCVCEGSF